MRLRRKAGIREKLQQYTGLLYFEPECIKNKWAEIFGNINPVHVELGTGKGAFLTAMATKNPGINYVGLERVPEVMWHAVRKIQEADLKGDNIRLILGDAEKLGDYFSPGEIERLYLNFSDPWPKNRHEKRRLTYPEMLRIYKKVLKDNAGIHFKTDNRSLFEYSLHAFAKEGFSLRRITYDLHAGGKRENAMTEYETRFVSLGQPIFRCEALIRFRRKVNLSKSCFI